MQISGLSSGSAAWALRDLFAPTQQQSVAETGQETTSRRQSLPTSVQACGFGGVGLSADTLSSLTQIQSGAPPSSSEMAADMISGLDTDSDGALSLEEARASGQEGAEAAFSILDSDADGSLSADELTAALEDLQPPPGAIGGARPAPPSGDELANRLVADADSNGDGGLDLSEVSATLGEDAEVAATSEVFSSLDTDGDGKLSSAELAAAFDLYRSRHAGSDATASLSLQL
jgi:Ca2+-binding EF-hand superfamily protein